MEEKLNIQIVFYSEMNERRNLRFHLLRLTNLEIENVLAVKYKYSHMPVLANLWTPREVSHVKNCLCHSRRGAKKYIDH